MTKEQNGWLVFGCEKQLYPKQPRELTWDIVKEYEAESLLEARYMSKIWNNWSFSWAHPRYKQHTDPGDCGGSSIDYNRSFFTAFKWANAQAMLGKSDAELKKYLMKKEAKNIAEDCRVS